MALLLWCGVGKLLRSAGSLRATATRRSFSDERGEGTGSPEGEDTAASGNYVNATANSKYVRLYCMNHGRMLLHKWVISKMANNVSVIVSPAESRTTPTTAFPLPPFPRR